MIRRLTECEVEFMIIGGYAVNYYGYVRATGDLDLWIRPDNLTRDKIVKMLTEDDFTDESLEHLKGLDFTVPQMFYYGNKPIQIDFLTFISRVNFDEAWSRKRYFEIDDLQVPVIHLEDLIKAKKNTGRHIDMNDIEELQKIKDLL